MGGSTAIKTAAVREDVDNVIDNIFPRPVLLIHGDLDEQTNVYQVYN